MKTYTEYKGGTVRSNPRDMPYSDTGGIIEILDYAIANNLDVARKKVRRVSGKDYSIQYRVGNATFTIWPSDREPLGSEAKTLSQLVAKNMDEFNLAGAILESAWGIYAVNKMNNSKTEQRRLNRFLSGRKI